MIKGEELAIWYISLFLLLHGFGWFYAWYIKDHPIKPTWVSVAIGTGAICIIEMLAIGGTLWIFGLLRQLWFMILIPLVALGAAGGPMTYLQQEKWNDLKDKNETIVDIWKD